MQSKNNDKTFSLSIGFKLTMLLIESKTSYAELLSAELSWSKKREGGGGGGRLSLSAFLGTGDIGVHIVHISHVIITYTLE